MSMSSSSSSSNTTTAGGGVGSTSTTTSNSYRLNNDPQNSQVESTSQKPITETNSITKSASNHSQQANNAQQKTIAPIAPGPAVTTGNFFPIVFFSTLCVSYFWLHILSLLIVFILQCFTNFLMLLMFQSFFEILVKNIKPMNVANHTKEVWFQVVELKIRFSGFSYYLIA